jgi:hypothetical protein
MPSVECEKQFSIVLDRVPRNQTTVTSPGIAPYSMEITCLRDALLHITNDGDFQSCSIVEAFIEITHERVEHVPQPYLGKGPHYNVRSNRRYTRTFRLLGMDGNGDCFQYDASLAKLGVRKVERGSVCKWQVKDYRTGKVLADYSHKSSAVHAMRRMERGP